MGGLAVTLMRLALDPHSLREGLYFFMYSVTHADTHSFLYSANQRLLDVFCAPELALGSGAGATQMLAAS